VASVGVEWGLPELPKEPEPLELMPNLARQHESAAEEAEPEAAPAQQLAAGRPGDQAAELSDGSDALSDALLVFRG
jgi:hypothetical protein